ncbi:hypothetical protein H9L13_12000 [Sphingomonas lutea]|uniref:SGNH hydrolase-type esterase domain-containing protein n=1 Tax=Sphingomonas lutea TaxID=1045317 RepID=A0A7G9SHI7_9SPHN|nr:SGNH/GDSL hydrolase family protein [Sphingomonas lutea]QNN67312.1 hypothetical protein H9L13_12000 [Sphingomonas lutea]
MRVVFSGGEGVMAYSGVFVFGDSLVDAGNALKLAEFYGDLTFSDLPDGAPSASRGYFQGRFSNGYTFADLLANKEIGTVTAPVFPYGYEDPWLDIPIAPWAGDPSGNNLNFAYGGAQIKQGSEVVSDLDTQTDAFRDAVDGDADVNALHMVTVGGNDIRSIVPTTGTIFSKTAAYARIESRADILLHELSQLVTMDGVKHILITGMADVGLVERYDLNKDNVFGPDTDLNNDGVIEAGEATRSAAATDYSRYLDHLIRTEVIPGLEALGATVSYVPLMDYVDETTGQAVTGALTANLNTIALLNGIRPDELGETPGEQLRENLLLYDNLLFFDGLHPNAQANALLGSFMHAQLNGAPWVETMPLLAADVDYRSVATIASAGEIDGLVIATAAGSSYTFQMLGVSSLTPYLLAQLGLSALPTGPILGDPRLNLLSSSGASVAADDDSGAGFDATLTFNVTAAGTYTLQAAAVGGLTGSYALTVRVDGAAVSSGNLYAVNNASALVIEGAGWAGIDTVSASVSYALAAGSAIEVLQTGNAKGKGAINLTGNDFAQQLIGNNGANVLDGKGGADDYRGGGGNDRFVLGGDGVDRILDYVNGDVVDLSALVKVGAGTNVAAGGFVRVTTTGKIQVDADGGGNGWATVATINGTGSVAIRYLSGGTTSTASLGRVTETSPAGTFALAGMIAGSGLSGPGFPAGPEAADTDAVTLARSATSATTVMIADTTLASASDAQMPPLASSTQTLPLSAGAALTSAVSRPQVSDAGRSAEPLDAGTALSAAAPAAAMQLAPSIAIPAGIFADAGMEGRMVQNIAEVGRVLLDALSNGPGPGTVEALLDALPARADGAVPTIPAAVAEAWATASAIVPMHAGFGLGMLGEHYDATALA